MKFRPLHTDTVEPRDHGKPYCDGYDEFLFVTHYATHSTVHSITVATIENACDPRQAGMFDHMTYDGRSIYRGYAMFNTWESAERHVTECIKMRTDLGSRVHIITSAETYEIEDN